MTMMLSHYPHYRPRRTRAHDFSRRMVQESHLQTSHLIYPVFVLAGHSQRHAVASMPGIERISVDLLLPVAETCLALGIPVMALFPVIETQLKATDGQEALNPDGLIPRA